MLDAGELAESLLCSACAYQHQLWSAIIEQVESPSYGRRAFAAFALESFIEDFQPDMREIEPQEYDDLCAVRGERARLDAQDAYNREQESKRKP